MTRISGSADAPEVARPRKAAYQRANWMLAHAGVTLTLAGVSPNSPEVQAIRRALRVLNLASGLQKGSHEKDVYPPGGPRYGRAAFGQATG